ncbi:hypothetical protein Pyn_26864 [Prunus yedoensis var. nudiflora]|uniref:Uncharacterized protein n=1 Tax=Prunus yedoensis var. nudiflora TaxID=2094558 RepID=A0A314YAJ0_PRUYE|nr:hypothetical protein Pyn_26864 [Prunus yedoensis var. nudiflora]
MGKSDRLSGAGVKYSNRVVRISLIGNKGVMKVKTDQAVDTLRKVETFVLGARRWKA